MKKQKSIEKLELEVAEFNLKVRPGDPVIYRDDSGEDHATVTTCDAYVMGGHTAVVMLACVRGCYLLERVRKGTQDE